MRKNYLAGTRALGTFSVGKVAVWSFSPSPSKRHTAKGVALRAFVDSAKPRFDPKKKNQRLAFVVAVIGRDRYTAAFSMSELEGKTEAWIIDEEDGAPLADGFELVVPTDLKPSRWVHGIASIRLIDTHPR